VRFVLFVSVIAALFAGAVYAGGRSLGVWDPYSPLADRAAENRTERAAGAVPRGWREHEVEDADVAISLPRAWRVVPGAALDAGDEELARTNPELAGFVADVAAGDDGALAFAAFDLGATARRLARRDRFATNMNVRVDPATTSLPGLRAGFLQVLERVPGLVPPIRDDRIRLPAGPAIRFRYRVEINTGPGRTAMIAVTQYGLVSRGRQFTLTFMTTSGGQPAYAAVFGRTARTFRLLGA
jgi:hypothetical protein